LKQLVHSQLFVLLNNINYTYITKAFKYNQAAGWTRTRGTPCSTNATPALSRVLP